MTAFTALPVLSSDAGLARYMDEVNRLPYLEQEEEYMLAKRWVDHEDVAAAQRLVLSHLRLVVKVAMGFKGYGLPVAELISEGNLGLMQAVKKFDPEKGFRLSTYAIWWIRASIQEYILRSWSLVKLGTTAAQKKLFFNLRRMKNSLQKLDNSALSPQEVAHIAHELDVPEQDVVEMNQRLSFGDQSLNDPLSSEEDGAERMDYLASAEEDHGVILAERDDRNYKQALFARALKELNDREKHILEARRLSEPPATLEDLSQELGISRERVRQIEARLMEKLQASVQRLALTYEHPKALPAL